MKKTYITTAFAGALIALFTGCTTLPHARPLARPKPYARHHVVAKHAAPAPVSAPVPLPVPSPVVAPVEPHHLKWFH